MQRKCACGSHTIAGGECDECGKTRLQRRAAGGAEVDEVPSVVHKVLSSPGHPLDAGTRAFFEPRFGQDFSRVRIHTDGQAAKSAQAVHALAYTVGRHVVFGAGQYQPSSVSGQGLLAHELTHVAQQSSVQVNSLQRLAIDPDAAQERDANRNASLPERMLHSQGSTGPALLQRACLTADACKSASGQTAKTAEVTAKAENKKKRERRKELCNKTPPDPACTSDGHGTRAKQLEKVVSDYKSNRLGFVAGVFIDKDIPDEWKAYRGDCDSFVPPITGGKHCIFTPEATEKEAAQFNDTKDATIGGLPRDEWRLFTLRVLMHETGHARYEEAKPSAPSATACDFDTIRSELHEIAADMDDFGATVDLLQRSSQPESAQETKLQNLFKDRWVPRATSNWKAIQCACECSDASEYVRKTATTMTAHWNTALKFRFHTELRKAIPSWPVAPPEPAEKAMRSRVDEIVNQANSQEHRMAFSTLNGLNMTELLETLERVHRKIGIKALIDFLPVAQGINKPRMEVALRAVELKTSGTKKTPEKIAEVLAKDGSLPDEQKKVVQSYLDDSKL